MSADTRPIAPARFAGALKDLSVGMLHLKVLEIRNSIAHLQYSNDQLRPFAEGSAVPLSSPSSSEPAAASAAPDQDCVDAIRENEEVIERMAERIALVRAEVEERGVSWTEFQSKEEVEGTEKEETERPEASVNGAREETHSAWTDGTFQTGTIRNGEIHMDATPGQSSSAAPASGAQGGSISDEQLRRAMEERMRNLGTDDDDDNDGGMHL